MRTFPRLFRRRPVDLLRVASALCA
ncbi:putative leader peptide [Streptomyces lavendulocolor]